MSRATQLVGFTVALAAGAAACGSLDQPDRRPPPSAGISPYRQAARIELCRNGARLVADAPPAGERGVCRAEARAPQSCSDHGACGAREACVCGRCTALLCRTNRDCPEGLLCSGVNPARCARRCTAAADCPNGGVCSGGVCTEACSSNEHCGQGELCLRGSCGVIACGPSGPSCGPGEICDPTVEAGALRAPGVLVERGLSVLYAELIGSGILRAESRDGVRFEARPPDPLVLGAAPAPLIAGGGVSLYYELGGAGIARVSSIDGIAFGEPELVLSAARAWEQGRVAAPGAVALGSDVLLFYEGGAAAGIGLAVAEDGGPFLPVSETPLLTPAIIEDGAHWTAIERLGAPWPAVVTDPLGERSLRLWFAATGREDTAPRVDGAAPLNASIGLAVARLGNAAADLAFVPFSRNPILSGVQNLAAVPETEPSVVRVGDEWRLYFDDGSGTLYLATNPPR